MLLMVMVSAMTGLSCFMIEAMLRKPVHFWRYSDVMDMFLGTVELTLCEGQSLGAVVVMVDGFDVGSGSVMGSKEGEK